MTFKVSARLHLSAAVVLAVISLSIGCARGPRQATGPHFRIATYNINYGMAAPESGVKALRETGADILCLQETHGPWMEFIRDRLKDLYPHILSRDWSGAGGMAFLSKVPLEEVEFVRPKDGWFPAWIVMAKTAVGPVQIMNVHLHPQLGEKGDVGVSVLYTTQKIRVREIDYFHARLGKDPPTIVLGDFNEKDGDAAVSYLKDRGFADALSEFDQWTATWRWPVGLITLRARFDHIMYSGRLRCLNARVVREGASDHLPVLADFESRQGT